MKIIKSFRKSMSMKMDDTGKLIIKAPFFVNKKTIDEFVNKNTGWIEKRKENIMKRFKKYREGEKFYFFGYEYELKFDDEFDHMFFDGMNFYISKNHKDKIKEKLINFYKREARKYIEQRAEEIALKNKLKFKALRITSARTRWGSCSSAKNVNFSFRLVQAPIKTIDYVIVHELAHLKVMNHSKKFWDLVEAISKSLYPGDYKIHKKWLNDHGEKLIY